MTCFAPNAMHSAGRIALVAAIIFASTRSQGEVSSDALARGLSQDSTLSPEFRVGDTPSPLVISCVFDGEGFRIVGPDPTRAEGERSVAAPWILIRPKPHVSGLQPGGARGALSAEESTGLLDLIARCRSTWPHLPVVLEFPAGSEFTPEFPLHDDTSPEEVQLRGEVMRAVSAFAIGRTLLILDPLSINAEGRWLLDRYPRLVAAAGDRPLFYRTTRGWRCLYRVTTGHPSAPATAVWTSLIRDLPDREQSAVALLPRGPEAGTTVGHHPAATSERRLPLTPIHVSQAPSPTPQEAATFNNDADPIDRTAVSDRPIVEATASAPAAFGPRVRGSGGVTGSFSAAPLNGSVEQTSLTDLSEPADSPRAPEAAPAPDEVHTTRPRPGTVAIIATTASRSNSALETVAPRAAEAPAPSEASQGGSTFPTWVPGGDQVVIPITPPAPSGSATTPRSTPQQPAFETDNEGWTDFTQFLDADSRIMYVAADGDDATGRVYSTHDALVGDDPMHPIGPIRPFATFQAARSQMRNFNADWVLFRRGDRFILPHGLYQHGTNFFFEHDPAGPAVRKLFGAYGPLSDDRPILTSESGTLVHGFAIAQYQYTNTAFVSLDLRASGVADGDTSVIAVSGNRNLFFEDCHIRGANSVIAYTLRGSSTIRTPGGLTFRRCVVVDAARTSGGHVQGLYVSDVEGCVLEECVFDRNGYVEDPTDPSSWTAPLFTDNRGTVSVPAGEGVQPHRTWFSRNLYLASYSGLYLRGCILSRSASSHQMRVGGVAERNVFIWNDQALAPKTQVGREWLHSQTIQSNLVLHEDHLLAQALQQGGLTASVGTGHEAVVHDNIVTGFNRPATYAFGATGIESYSSYPSQIGDRVTFTNNIALADRGTLWMIRGTTGVWGGGYRTVDGSGNLGVLTGGGIQSTTTELVANTSWRLGSNRFSGGAFRIGDPLDRRVGDMSFFQARGFEPGSAYYSSVMSLAVDAGWHTQTDSQGRRGWERDIVSYMHSIDPHYIPDEHVTVDDGVPLAARRPDAPRVWRVLAGLHPACNAEPMSEEDAKRTARRYHAFLTFIERARSNRKGAWNRLYTADSLNNYIREGFGKQPVGGAYTATLTN